MLGLTNEQYGHVSDYLEGGSIGQHLRHILEFYDCLLDGMRGGRVNYDRRRRDLRISNDRFFALQRMDEIIDQLSKSGSVQPMFLEGQFSTDESELIVTPTSWQRELIYCLEHSIHHQALIRVVLQETGLVHLIDHDFGIASSTIRFQQSKGSD